MNITSLINLIDNNNDCLNVNKYLIKALGIEETVFYSYLIDEYKKNSESDNLKIIDGEKYFLCTVEEIENNFKLSPFRQRNILNKLSDMHLLDVKFGQSRARYININEDDSILENILYPNKISNLKIELWNRIQNQIQIFYQEKDLNQDKYIYEQFNLHIPKVKAKNLEDFDVKSLNWLMSYENPSNLKLEKISPKGNLLTSGRK